ncbi:unnamed protein product [Rotaria sp. Silwood1]|nr:unnamed protein product [Rotaria sp. Silwood1]CAF0902479.1 unnamed protein product [Rotaria sp. Silwood1]CAF4537913.1 unnamed protein product [Rotaria sp. Silwood1]
MITVSTIQHPIGPSFISTITTKQKLYYNNIGIRLDCSAIGNPLPVLTWFRINGNDDQSWIHVQSSEFINLYDNGSLFIRPFREYFKTIHAGIFICRAENPAGSIQTIPIQVKPQIYDTYEIEVRNPYGFEQSSVIISCEISPPSASSYVNIMGWLEKTNNQIIELDLQPKTKYNLLANKNLIIHNLTKSDDNRSYACIVNNQIDNHTRQSRFKLLRVRNRSPFGPELSIINNTEYRAQVGNIIELPCGIASLSNNAQISWWKDGIELNNIEEKLYNNSLIVQLSSSTDSGNYVCQIDDEIIGRMTSYISLKVNLPIQCNMNIQQTNINAGSNTELICSINTIENPSIQWQWYHNSISLPTKLNQYMIINATRDDMGMYQCCYISSSTDLNSCCAQTQIRIINSPPFIHTNSQKHLNSIVILPENNSHSSIDLSLTIYGDPIPEINIFKDGEKLLGNYSIKYLPSGDIFFHYAINISNINDTGLYECQTKNFFGSISSSKHINIKKQKPFIQPLSNLTFRTGEQFTLTCYASGHPNLHLQWIDQTNNEIVNTSSTSPLLFTSINTRSNIYSCQAINPYGKVSSQLFLTIQIPAKILSVTSNQTVKINSKLKIHCITEGDNQIELRLKYPQLNKLNLIENKSENTRKLSIIIDNIQMSDSGLYECYVKNNYSEDHSIFEIIVQNIPDKIENIFIENSQKIFWMKPFDGNSKILKYILRIQSKQGLSWSNETIIIIDNSDITNYSFENIFSQCMISVIIQAVNIIGSSLPSERIYFQTNVQQLRVVPYNLTAVDISSKSLILTWQYPSFQICNKSFIEFVIEIIDQYNQTIIKTHNYHSTILTISQLKSYTYYTFVIYARNELGSSPKSKPLKIKTLESAPLAMIGDLTGTLLNSSTAYITWTFEQHGFQLLNGKFRTFVVTMYENFDMSTLTAIETIKTNLILYDLHSSSQYFVSVSICNYFDCSSSSIAIDIRTPSSILETSTTIIHPINKPLVLNCPYATNNSLNISYPKLSETYSQYQCGSKLFNIRYYDKPSSIRAKIHYTMSNEIGLKIFYPFEIIETITITYKIKDNSFIHELNISPPLSNIRLTNLSCGNIYEIMIYTSNQAGFSSTEYLITKTDGSIPSLIQSKDLLRTVSNNYVIVNMATWMINECPILSYDIEIFPIKNSDENNLNRYLSFKNQINEIKIDHLKSDHDYQLNIKIHSQAGEKLEIIPFRTTKNNNQIKLKHKQIFLFLLLTIISFVLIFILIFIMMKFCQHRLKRTELFNGQTKTSKPMFCSSYSNKHHRYYHRKWLQTENDFTIENYTNKNRSTSLTSEDSQGNINPYAVTGDTMNYKDKRDHGYAWRETEHNNCQLDSADIHPSITSCERYFRPINLESSLSNDQNSLKRNPLTNYSEKYLLPNIVSTVSSSENKLFSAFTYISTSNPITKKISNHDQSLSSADSGVHSSYTQSPRCPLHNFSFDHSLLTNQDNPLYATYDEKFFQETNSDSYKHQQYSLV